jgi:hypothetical protein
LGQEKIIFFAYNMGRREYFIGAKQKLVPNKYWCYNK